MMLQFWCNIKRAVNTQKIVNFKKWRGEDAKGGLLTLGIRGEDGRARENAILCR